MKTLQDVIRELELVQRRLNKIAQRQSHYIEYDAVVCISKLQKIINAIKE